MGYPDKTIYTAPWGDTIALPGYCNQDAMQFLCSVDSGGMGGGSAMMQMHGTIPVLRDEYKRLLADASAKLPAMERSLSEERLNQWKISERTRIAKLVRMKQGPIASVILDLRDRYEYGRGGRTEENLIRRAIEKAQEKKSVLLTRQEALGRLSVSWNESNREVNAAARNLRYFKHAGRAFFVFGVGSSVYTILTAPEQERLQVAAREGAGMAGGAVASTAAVVAVAAFGIVTGGWGLVAVGLIAGASGGALAEYGTDRFFFSHDSERVVKDLDSSGMIDHTALTHYLPHR